MEELYTLFVYLFYLDILKYIINIRKQNKEIIPNQPSWRSIPTTNIFTVCRKMTNEGEVLEGSTVNSHMMKNTEWGAVAILSQSKYGVFNPESSTGANGDATKETKGWNSDYSYFVYSSSSISILHFRYILYSLKSPEGCIFKENTK